MCKHKLKRCVARGLRAVASIPARIRAVAGERLARRSNFGADAPSGNLVGQSITPRGGRRNEVTGASPQTPQGFAPQASRTLNELVNLSWPIAVALLGDSAMGLVDTKLVSSLGAAALGGVGIGTMLMYLNYAVVFGLMRGVKIRTSHAVGEGRAQDGWRYAEAGLVMGVAVGVLAWIEARDVSPILRLLKMDPATIPYARDFLAARTYGAPAICSMTALVQHRQGIGDTRTPMIIGLAANVFNAVLAWALIHGHWGLPILGVKGAGYGTACAEWGECLFLLAMMLRDRRKGDTRNRPPLLKAIREVAQLGVPTGIQFGLECLAFTAFTAVLGNIGGAEIAGHQVAFAIIRTSFLPGVAVAESASVLVGRSLGARSLPEADRATRAAIALAAGFMTACGVVFALGGGLIASAFTDDPDVASVVKKLLLVAAVFQTVDAITIVLRGALRGAKDVKVVAAIGVAVCWLSVPMAAWLLGRVAGMGAVGGWFGFLAESSIAAALFWRRWRRGGWRGAYANEVSIAPEAVVVAAA